jgi:predicted O-linked N-acetylglucosamine transferase (SPINDLY family)
MHSVAYNFEPILDGRDRRNVQVFGYGNVARPDEVTDRLKAKFDHYRSIRGLDDHTVVRMIERDEIDILVAVAGHAGDNRLTVLAYKPAPIQVDYQGVNTTGMQQVDYRFTDSLLDPAGSEKFYVEASVYLPGGVHCYRPPDFAPPVVPLPAERAGHVTFGSFNGSLKSNPFVVSLWAEVLKNVDDSRLLMKFHGGGDRETKDRYLEQFRRLQISPERVEIHGWKSPVEHLKLYGRVDIALDTYPFNGCLTTLEGMWMGVPTVTLVGESLISRAGLSILSRVGLEFFAASTRDEYVAKATALARNRPALAKIRASMRQRMTASTLCDSKTYAAGLETAYRKMWRRWCRSRDVDVPEDRCEQLAPGV